MKNTRDKKRRNIKRKIRKKENPEKRKDIHRTRERNINGGRGGDGGGSPTYCVLRIRSRFKIQAASKKLRMYTEF